jgi:DNA-binding transcriptional regulator LsrR (DeoR family)
MIEVLKLQRDGKTVREIALILNMSKSTVQRRLTVAKQNNVTIPDEREDTVPDVPSVPHLGQTGQAGQVKELRLPYKDKEDIDEL